ncbi:hypothetical protein ABW21_db0208007 [Orbilia brochopaga]|nr:hypothetical protein ABW21_db0208007 [Drechslerella brochopaga]
MQSCDNTYFFFCPYHQSRCCICPTFLPSSLSFVKQKKKFPFSSFRRGRDYVMQKDGDSPALPLIVVPRRFSAAARIQNKYDRTGWSYEHNRTYAKAIKMPGRRKNHLFGRRIIGQCARYAAGHRSGVTCEETTVVQPSLAFSACNHMVQPWATCPVTETACDHFDRTEWVEEAGRARQISHED